ncbi:MAG: SoxR reducing system RseC family protein, partial [Spirochaetales bacterium]|nr:SoxR reducing system RseC family protein [Spirochaetales bacterium]
PRQNPKGRPATMLSSMAQVEAFRVAETAVQVDESSVIKRAAAELTEEVEGFEVHSGLPEVFPAHGVAFAFVIPLIVVVAVLFGTADIFGNEELAALAGIGTLVPYYAGLYALRRRFERIVRFEATPTFSVASRPMLGKEGIS